MNADDVIAKILKAEGVEWVAAFPNNSLIDAVVKEGIRPIISRHERTGVNIADGFSRVKNGSTYGVFIMQVGPGAENAYGGVAQAYADSIPILLIPGGQERSLTETHPNFEAVENYRGITKWAGNINMASRVPEFMHMAYSQLRYGRPGPVLIEVPVDVQQEDFPGSFDYEPVAKLTSTADGDDVRNLVETTLAATCPVINAGHGVHWAEATDELLEFAELTNIPVMTTLAGKSAFPENHPLALGAGGYSVTNMVHHFLSKTDFVLGIGTSFSNNKFNAPMPDGVTLGQITNCAEDLGKNRNVRCGAIGDAKLVLRQMILEAKSQLGEGGRPDKAGVAAEIAKVKASFLAQWASKLHSDEVPINPYRVITELSKAVDVANTIITHDSGYPRDQLVPFWESVTPRGYLGWGKSTQLGYGLGLALGAKLAAPEKQVINVMGDASFGMAGMDVETGARAGIPIMTVVLNNGVMTNYSNYMPLATEKYALNRLSGDYLKVGEALGAHSERVETPDELAPAFRRAAEANTRGETALVEVMVKEEATSNRP
jgi:thiamine pyrophosphate-dependent acetolactate synthase large subunit-like protein